jgi:hypothetical protein
LTPELLDCAANFAHLVYAKPLRISRQRRSFLVLLLPIAARCKKRSAAQETSIMGVLLSLLAGFFKTLFVRLPLGIWLAVVLGGAWVGLERQYEADYPLLPCTTTWPVELVNPTYPDSPSHVPFLARAIDEVAALNLGVSRADLAFGQPGYGALLGVAFGLLLAWPCGAWKTLCNYSGFLLFPVRLVLLGVIYAATFGAAGAWLAATWNGQLITSGYLAAFGFVTPLLVPLPFWILAPLFPSAARRQAVALVKQAKHEAGTSLVAVAKHDPTLGDVTQGKAQQEWSYYATISGVFIATLLAEKRGVSAWRRRAVERQIRKQLNRRFEKGEHGLTAVMQFSREHLERKTKFTTEVLIGLWLAMQMKGDLDPQRDRELAASLGAHLLQGMNGTWYATSSVGTVLGAMLLWTGVAGLAVAAAEPQQFEQQLARLGIETEAPAEPVPMKEAVPGAGQASKATDQPTGADESANDDAVKNDTDVDESQAAVAAATSSEQPTLDDAPVDRTPAQSAAELASPEDAAEQSERAKPATETAEPSTVVAPTASATPASRLWSHSSGRTIQGTARSYWNGAVELERTDGRKAFVKIDQLSAEDRQAIYRQFATSPGATNLLPGSLIARDWAPASGGRQVTAALVKVTAESVELLRADGKLFTIPLAQLSEADRAFAQEQLQATPTTKE